MIIVEFLEGQGLGNQLWNYFSGIGIAIANNMEFRIASLKSFKGNEFLSLKSLECTSSEFMNASEINEQLFYLDKEDYYASDVDYRFFHLVKRRTYILRGLFQSEAYIESIENYNDWIEVKTASFIDHKTVLNIRGGEYKRQAKFHLPKSYWDNALKALGSPDFTIVTDDAKYSQQLYPNAQVVTGIANSFLSIYNADFVIVSNSTFSYWPIKLGGTPKTILAPYNFARYNVDERWCSWANVYRGWKYLDKSGVIHESNVIEELCEDQRLNFENTYYVLGRRRGLKARDAIKLLIPNWALKILRNWLN